MKKITAILSAVLMGSMLFAGIASAHVTVYPKQTTQGTYEKFTVRVPTEKEVPTVKVKVDIPQDVNISRFEPLPGWTYEISKDATGKITDVTWTATGEGLTSTEFGEFNMQGKVGETATSLAWKAVQTYKDGSVVEWVGAEGSDHPASVSAVNAKTAEASSGGSSASGLPLYLSIAALVIAIASLVVSLKRKKSAA